MTRKMLAIAGALALYGLAEQAFAAQVTFAWDTPADKTGIAGYFLGCGPATGNHVAGVYNLFDVYVQYANCLLPGQAIKTEIGWKPIEDVNVGDKVYTHTGQLQKVLRKFIHVNNNRVIKVGVYGTNETLSLTNEHPIYVVDKDKLGYIEQKLCLREYLGNKIRNNEQFIIPHIFKQAKDIKLGDLLVEKIDMNIEDVQELDLTQYLNNDYIVDEKNDTFVNKYSITKHPLRIKVDNDFCQFIGLFAADGHWNFNKSCGDIIVTCHQNDDKAQDRGTVSRRPRTVPASVRFRCNRWADGWRCRGRRRAPSPRSPAGRP